MDIFQWSFTTFRKKRKKKEAILTPIEFPTVEEYRWYLIKTVQVQCQTRHDQPTIKNRRAPMEIIIWVSERKERGREGEEARRFEARSDWISVCTGTWTEYRSSKGRWHGQEKKKSERERESAGRLKAREDLSSNGSKDRYSRSATNHFDEVTKISPFPSSLPVSLSLPFSTP